MGRTYLTAKMRKRRAAKRAAQAKFLVDSGAIFTKETAASWVPSPWRASG